MAAYAQNEIDALRFSYTANGGTARSFAMANAFGALGADLSSIYINPAGLGLYRKSEISLGLGNEFNNTSATHFGSTVDADTYNFNLRNVGIALSYLNEAEESKWKSTHIGISYGRTASFSQVLNINGFNPKTSLLDHFVNEANGTSPEFLASNFPFTSSLAWETYTMDPLDTVMSTYTALFTDGQVDQSYTLESSGRMSETAFAFSANYNHKLYLGAGLAFVSARYEETYVHHESRGNVQDELKEMEYQQDLTTRGNGINFRLGILYRLSNGFRVGGSFQSPSFMVINDTWATSMKSKFEDGTNFEQDSPNGEFSWSLNTPMRFTLSGAGIIGARGLISVDYEFMNLSSAKMKRASDSYSDYDFAFENERINNLYTNSNELRVGTEWKVRKLILRGGFSMRHYPIKDEYVTRSDATMGYSLGIGYRVRAFSMDLSFRRSEYFLDRYLYDSESIEPTTVDITQNELILGFAYRY